MVNNVEAHHAARMINIEVLSCYTYTLSDMVIINETITDTIYYLVPGTWYMLWCSR